MKNFDDFIDLLLFDPRILCFFKQDNGENVIQIIGLDKDKITTFELYSESEIEIRKMDHPGTNTSTNDTAITLGIPEDEERKVLQDKAYKMIVKLWSRDGTSPDYNKGDWNKLVSILQELGAVR